jgi:lipoic acid synthetase
MFQMSIRKPGWLKIKVKYTEEMYRVSRIVREYGLNTVCEEARCPNIYECWGAGTATFLILGDICTRNCRFCSVKKGNPGGIVDRSEPFRVAMAVRRLGLKYVVITSVDRDDLNDGGSSIYSETINIVKKMNPGVYVEVLIPDFLGDYSSLKKVVDAGPDVLSHNIETVKRLTPVVRDRRASYHLSLEVLKMVKDIDSNILTKSGIMLGLGETFEEVVDALEDLRSIGVDIITIGQYLMPSKRHYDVVEYVRPEVFKELEGIAYDLGFRYVASGPNVRSSYMAGEYYIMNILSRDRSIL